MVKDCYEKCILGFKEDFIEVKERNKFFEKFKEGYDVFEEVFNDLIVFDNKF